MLVPSPNSRIHSNSPSARNALTPESCSYAVSSKVLPATIFLYSKLFFFSLKFFAIYLLNYTPLYSLIDFVSTALFSRLFFGFKIAAVLIAIMINSLTVV